jgi:hypothetical protein
MALVNNKEGNFATTKILISNILSCGGLNVTNEGLTPRSTSQDVS